MFIGTVQCEIELSKAHAAFEGYRLLLVHADHDVEWEGDVVAIDMSGAQVGDMVAVALAPLGSKFDIPDDLPIDAAVIGIVGSITTPSEEGEDEEQGGEQPRARTEPARLEEERPRREGRREPREGRRDREDKGPRRDHGRHRHDQEQGGGRHQGHQEPRRSEPAPAPAPAPAREPEKAPAKAQAVEWEDEAEPAPKTRESWPKAERAQSSAADDGGFNVVWDSPGNSEDGGGSGNVKNKRGGRRRR